MVPRVCETQRPMSGLLITYQRFLCEDVRFRRRRGYGADFSEVILPVTSFPVGFSFEVPNPGELGKQSQHSAPNDPGSESIQAGIQSPAARPGRFEPEGTLVMAGLRPDGSRYDVKVKSLFVIRIDTDQLDDVGDIAWVKLTLVDERYFWPRGLVSRWTFLRSRADGSIAEDSLDLDGDPLTRAEVFKQYVAPGLFRSPNVGFTTSRWDVDAALEFIPFSPAVVAMATMVDDTGVEDPCLWLDGSIAIYDRGESRVSANANGAGAGPVTRQSGGGHIAFAPDGKGPNSQPIPLEFVLSAGGKGQRFLIEASYPEDYVVVVGLPKIATVALDDWEPVLISNGKPFFLSDELVGKLTGGKFDLSWLQAWILQPSGVQALVSLSKDVIRLFQEQAYRLFRMPKAELIEDGFYSGPGPNANLLPMLDRAGTVGGRRIKPTVQSYTFQTRHKTATFSQADVSLLESFTRLSEAKRLIRKLSIQGKKAIPNIGPDGQPDRLSGNLPDSLLGLSGPAMVQLPGHHRRAGLDAIRVREQIEQIRDDLGPEAAQLYESAVSQRAQSQGGAAPILFDLANELVSVGSDQAQRLGVEDADDLNDNQRAKNLILDALEKAAKDAGAKLEASDSQAETRTRAGVPPGGAKPITLAYAQVNLPRFDDSGGRVIDRDLGIVRTTGLAGHVADVDVPTPADTVLLPCPVRVLFGATVRPRLDVPPGQAQRPTTGDAPADAPEGTCVGGDNFTNVITENILLFDKETIYTAAFKRVARGVAEQIDIKDVPLDQATRVGRRWRELIPLFVAGQTQSDVDENGPQPGNNLRRLSGGEQQSIGNKSSLDRDAKEVADQIFTRLPVVRTSAHLLADAWPIQCDGIIAGIEITVARDEQGIQAGFTTALSVGSNPPDTQSNTTRPRRSGSWDDAFAREAFGR